MKKSKVLLSHVISLFMIVTILTGCHNSTKELVSDSNNKEETISSNDISSSTNKTTLTLWTTWTNEQSQTPAINKLVEKFNSSQNKIEVRVENAKSISTDANSFPDIGIIDNPNMAAFADQGLLTDITSKINDYEHKNDFYPGPIASCMLNNKYYGVPVGSNDLALFYNKDMFNNAGLKPPTTFNELKTTAKKLTKGTTYGLGIATPNSNYETTTFQYIPFLISAGSEYNKISSEEGISSIQFLTDILNNGSMSKEIASWEQDDLEKQFAKDKAAMIVDGPWIINTLKKDAPNLNWGVVKIPREKKYSSVLGGEDWVIFKGKHEDEAWEFIKFTQNENVLNEFCSDMGYIPSRKDIAERNESITKDPIMSVFLDELQYAMPRGPEKKWPEISKALASALQESLTNTKTPEQAAKDAQVKIDSILE